MRASACSAVLATVMVVLMLVIVVVKAGNVRQLRARGDREALVDAHAGIGRRLSRRS